MTSSASWLKDGRCQDFYCQWLLKSLRLPLTVIHSCIGPHFHLFILRLALAGAINLHLWRSSDVTAAVRHASNGLFVHGVTTRITCQTALTRSGTCTIFVPRIRRSSHTTTSTQQQNRCSDCAACYDLQCVREVTVVCGRLTLVQCHCSHKNLNE